MGANLYDVLAEIAAKKTIHYVQVGGNDGISNDPLWPYLQRYSWTIGRGDVFEPHPIYFERLAANLGRFPQIHCHNLAIGSRDCELEQTLYYLDPADIAEHGLPKWTEGISSFYLDKNALGGIGPQQTAEMHNLIKPHIRETQVTTKSLEAAFESLGIEGCDFLLTDTEGHDWEIVKQWDFARFGKPTLIHSEVVCLNDQEKDEFLSWLDENGYEFNVHGQNVTARLRST